MDAVKSYKCPCCSDALIFSADTQMLHCQSCGNEFPFDTLSELCAGDEGASKPSKYNWQRYEKRSFDADNSDFSAFSCSSCGAEITGDSTLGATICPYCGSNTIAKKQFEGSLCPDYIIPFKVDKKAAMKAFEDNFKTAPFLPDEFRDKKRIEQMQGVYVPFWMFDCSCNAHITYDAQRTTLWSDTNYDYTKTDYFRLIRKGSVDFENIPADGSSKADDAHMESVGPYDYSEAMEYRPEYLSGYFADRYDVSSDQCVDRANERVKNSTVEVFGDTTDRYSLVIPQSTSIEFSDGKIRYALLPVWMLNIKYNGQNYHFSVNGQTAKVVGEYPVDEGKKKRYFAKVLAIGYAISAVVALLLLL